MAFTVVVMMMSDSAQGGCVGGTYISGGNWFLGANGQTCDETCVSRGSGCVYDSLTSSFAGSSGSLANCKTAANAVGCLGNAYRFTVFFLFFICLVTHYQQQQQDIRISCRMEPAMEDMDVSTTLICVITRKRFFGVTIQQPHPRLVRQAQLVVSVHVNLSAPHHLLCLQPPTDVHLPLTTVRHAHTPVPRDTHLLHQLQKPLALMDSGRYPAAAMISTNV